MRRLVHLTVALCIAVPIFVASSALADVKLPHILSNHMVLQAEQPITVWGWAEPGEKVTVKLSGQSRRVTTGKDGRWQVTLKPMKAVSTAAEMTVSGKNQLTVSDILIGEVWLASGQSNMEKPFRNQRGQKDVMNAAAELAAANTPQIRLFKVKRARVSAAATDVEGQWVVTTPQSLDETRFSAAAYVFGKRLNATLNTPVGLIDSTWGGTRIEAWTAPEGFNAIPSLKRFTGAPAGAKVDGADVSALYNGMIAPLAPFGLKGAIWYQGEANIIDSGAAADYTDKMQALIGGWRGAFNQDFAFYYVQVAPFLYHVVRPNTIISPEAAPELWEAQADALRIPGTGMVVTTDLVDDLFDIHPRDKKTVGERLAGLALSKTYGRTGLTVTGPIFNRLTVQGDRAFLTFDDIGGWLISKDGKALSWFAISGADGVWYPAVAIIAGDRVEVSSAFVRAPVSVRFAWDEAAQPNLVNKEGLPALPFRSYRH